MALAFRFELGEGHQQQEEKWIKGISAMIIGSIKVYVAVELMSLIHYCSNIHPVGYHTTLANASTSE